LLIEITRESYLQRTTFELLEGFSPEQLENMVKEGRIVREEAAARLKCALREFIIEGVHTTLPYLWQVMEDEQKHHERDNAKKSRKQADSKPDSCS